MTEEVFHLRHSKALLYMKNPRVNPQFQVSGSTPMASSHRFLTPLHASPDRKQVLLCISPFRPGILKSSSTGTLVKDLSLRPCYRAGWQKQEGVRLSAQLERLPFPRHRQEYLSSEISFPSWSARPTFLISKRTRCGVAVESGASEEKVGKQIVDGSILTGDGSELQSTLRLVECAMLAATAGLAFFLSNLFRLEGYLGCFFPLPVVISSMRWGASAGRKTMMATAMLLLVLSGPLKSASYLLMHGFVGLAIGALWKWRVNWFASLALCTLVRSFGAMGFVLLSSWLLRENLLALITINAHASVSYMLAALGINIIPTMSMIYFIFAVLLFINCGSFVFLLHVLYAIFLRRLGIETKVDVPGWIERAI